MRVPLLGGAYTASSIIASAQRSVNLYPEENIKSSQAPVPVTQYPTPGLTLLVEGLEAGWRCLYRDSKGALYGVLGTYVYYIDQFFTKHEIGRIVSENNPVYMADNGLAIIVVDGSPNGYAIEMGTNSFAKIGDANFLGSTRADYLDGFFILNVPDTNQWYISLALVTYADLISTAGGTAFDSTDIATKNAYPDPIQGIIVMHREIWLVGELTSEIWYNVGNTVFPFEIIPGAFIEHGTVSAFSLATQDLSVYYLSQDKQGSRMVFLGRNYQVQRISTYAIEQEWATYERVDDSIGFTYQQKGHTFYVLIFPSANKTWVFDEGTGLWHERAWTDDNGFLNRIRPNCVANAYNKIVVGDWENGNLYAWDTDAYTDNGDPISHIRGFPHLVTEANRNFYSQFIADMQVGTNTGAIDGSTPFNPPVVSLRWSDDRGASYGNRVQQSMGAAGQYLTSIQFQRLGMARDRVFELSWSAPMKTALQGAWVQSHSAGT